MNTSESSKTEPLPNEPKPNEVGNQLPNTKGDAQEAGVGSKAKNVTDRIQGAEAAVNSDDEMKTEVTRETLAANFYHDMIVADNLRASFGHRDENEPMPAPAKRS